MWRPACLSFIALSGALAQSGGKQTRPDSAVVRDSVIAAELRFFAKWDSTWKFSERDRHQFSTFGDAQTEDGSRHQNYHCHPEYRGMYSGYVQGRLIQSEHSWFAVCPSFDIGDIKIPVNERLDLDQSLLDVRRKAIHEARAELIAKLDSAVRAYPGDDMLAGQRVRMLVDQWEFDSALTATTNCGATRWWCAALTGYVRAARGENNQADSAFKAAFAAMPADEKCRWNDYAIVVDYNARDDYSNVPCAKRDELNTRMWWLSDPLLIEPGNEREVEQNVRTVTLALRTELGHDERFDWNPKVGGDARHVMIERYGWPAYMFWGGPLQDRAHTGYLGGKGSRPSEPYVTYEYFGSRVHTIPVWSAISDPFHALPNDWTLTPDALRDSGTRHPQPAPPSVMYSPVRGAPKSAPYYWWPVEHFQPRRPLVQLPSGQQVMLRRQDSTLLAVATDLVPEQLLRVKGDVIEGMTLVRSEAPGSAQRLATMSGIAGSSVEMHAMVGAVPAIAGLEFAATGAKAPPGGRLRFGIAPPKPLSALAAGEVAISDPVILRAMPGGAALPTDPDAALKQMATSHIVSNAGTIGVYWETYGFKPSDSVEVAVWVERSTGQSIVRKFGIVLGVATDLNTPVSTSWREPEPGRRAFVSNDGGVPIIGRSVTINTTQIPAGEYRLEIAVRKAGTEPVRGATTFVVK